MFLCQPGEEPLFLCRREFRRQLLDDSQLARRREEKRRVEIGAIEINGSIEIGNSKAPKLAESNFIRASLAPTVAIAVEPQLAALQTTGVSLALPLSLGAIAKLVKKVPPLATCAGLFLSVVFNLGLIQFYSGRICHCAARELSLRSGDSHFLPNRRASECRKLDGRETADTLNDN